MLNNFIKRPLITERSINQTKNGFYTFMVSKEARKEEIRRTIEKQFSVKVLSIRTIKMPGKTRKAGKTGRDLPKEIWKKAIVKLAKDQKISAFDVS